MSMLSAQCDELRRLANTLDTRYRYADDIVTALREAADTILSLRDRAQELQAENSKQRELLLHMQTCMEYLEYPEFDCSKCPMDNSTGNCDFERRMRELEVTS